MDRELETVQVLRGIRNLLRMLLALARVWTGNEWIRSGDPFALPAIYGGMGLGLWTIVSSIMSLCRQATAREEQKHHRE